MKKIIKIGIVVIILATIVVCVIVFDIPAALRALLEWIENIGIAGPLVFMGIYIVATVFFIPGSLLTLGAGAVFGLLWGSVLVSIGSTIGATMAFLVGRYLFRDWVEKKAQNNQRFKDIDAAIGREGGKIIFLLRLSPLLPFNLSNYIYSMTKINIFVYMLASWVGMIPGTIMYVYIGTLIKSVAELGSEGRVRTTGEWILYGVGLAATVIGALYITRVARRAIQKNVPAAQNEGNTAAT